MSILFCDSVEHYTTAQAGEKWTGVTSTPAVQASSGRGSRGNFNLNVGSRSFDIDVTAGNVIGVGMALRFDNPANSAGTTDQILKFREGTTVHAALSINRSMQLRANRGTTAIDDSGSIRLPTSTWMYLETRVEVHNTTGTIDVRLNGVNILSFTGDTQNGGTASIDNIMFEGVANANMKIHDIVIWDDNGAAPYNTWLGDVQVDAVYPDGDGTTNQFTATGAGTTNADRVDEATHDTDTTYNEDATVNDVDLYTFAALPATPGTATVLGVQIVAAVKSDDGGAKSAALIARPVSTNHIGASQALGSAYSFIREMHQINPEDSLAWAESDIDGGEFGIEVSA